MKYLIFLTAVVFVACSNQSQEVTSPVPEKQTVVTQENNYHKSVYVNQRYGFKIITM